jgi:hypothetical protein
MTFDDAVETLLGVARLFGTIIGIVAVIAVGVLLVIRVLDARAMDARRTAATNDRKRSQIAAAALPTPRGVPAPSDDTPQDVSVDAGGPDGGVASESTTPEGAKSGDVEQNRLWIAPRSPIPRTHPGPGPTPDDPPPDEPFGVAVPVG